MWLFGNYKKSDKNDSLNITRFVLDFFDIKHTVSSLNKSLDEHIDSPSLLSVKDVLKDYGVESVAINRGNYSYADFETPFICSVQQANWAQSYFTVVQDSNYENVTYLDPESNRLIKSTISEFGRIDKEVILLLDSTNKKDELNFVSNREREKAQNFLSAIPACAFVFVLVSTIFFQYRTSSDYIWLSFSYLLTSVIGLLTALLLIWHDIDAYNPFLREVCGGGGRKINCDAVLSSSGAQFLGISWSIWGGAYFSTFFVTQVIFAGQPSYIVLWSLVSLLAFSYVPYSLYYQIRVIGQWCPLCLCIQAVLILNTIFSIIAFSWWSNQIYLDFNSIFNVSVIGISSLLFTFYAVPLLKKSRESLSYEKRWKKLRFNPDIFQSLLYKSTPVSISPEGIGIVLGNPDAQNEIIKVCNPYCGPCSKAHPELEYIIKSNKNIKLRIIFTASGREDDITNDPVKHFLAIAEKYSPDGLQKAIDEWYLAETKNYGEFAEKYPINGELSNQMTKIHAMDKWCEDMKIRATPTLYINGWELPDSYRISELKNFF